MLHDMQSFPLEKSRAGKPSLVYIKGEKRRVWQLAQSIERESVEMYSMNLWQHIFVVCCVLVGTVQPRHVPLSNYEVDWVNYIRNPSHLRDARVIYTFFKNNIAKQHVRRDLAGVIPEEEDILEVLTNSKEDGNFTGYQHPFYYMMDPTTRDSNLFLPVPTNRPSVVPARHYVKAIKSLTRDFN